MKFSSLTEQLDGEREERIKNAKDRLSFGISFLDDALVGIFKNDLVLLAGRSGQGKSEVALHISLTNAKSGKRVVHLALEAEPREVGRRMLFKLMARKFYSARPMSERKPSYIRWYAGEQEDLLAPYYESSVKELRSFEKLSVLYRGVDFGLDQLRQIFVAKKGEADLVVCDHLHYFDYQDENENRAHKEIVKTINELAKEYSVPVVLVSHIRKSDKRYSSPVPDLEDIHGSSDIFKIATKAIFIAPAKDQMVTPETKTHRFPTYFRIGKCRQDGSLNWFIGLTSFDVSKGDYDQEYVLGEFNQKNEFVRIEKKPFWAKGAR